jgi:3'(2'), 5'-bisphosphate nucleotidase
LSNRIYLDQVTAIARNAGKAIMQVYEGEVAVSHKQDNSPLTQADLAAHHIIEDGLASLLPQLPVLSEESDGLPYGTRASWDSYWLVDPLDGTREFIKRNGEFTVNIALIEQHQPVLGVVYAPALDLLYFAVRGQGAWRQQGDQPPQQISVKHYDAAKVLVAGSRSHGGDRLTEFLTKLGDYELISMGSSLKICLVAEGRADVYPRLGPTSEWDTAAAQCVLEEAGGKLVDEQNRPFRYNTRESLLNPEFFATGASGPDWGRYLV